MVRYCLSVNDNKGRNALTGGPGETGLLFYNNTIVNSLRFDIDNIFDSYFVNNIFVFEDGYRMNTEADRDAYKEQEQALLTELQRHPGPDTVTVFLRDVRAVKKLPAQYRTSRDEAGMAALTGRFGEENVKIVHKAWTGY